MQWLDDIPSDDVFALAKAYQDEPTATTGATSQETEEVFEEDEGIDGFFEVPSPNKKTVGEGLKTSLSSLSSGSLELGEEAEGAERNDKHKGDDATHNSIDKTSPEATEPRQGQSNGTKNTPNSFRHRLRKNAVHNLPTVSTSVPVLPISANQQTVSNHQSRKRSRRNSVNSAAILARHKVKQDRKAAITITLLVALFLVFKVPYAFALLGNAYRGEYWITMETYEAVTWLYWIKSVSNPFVYAFISKRFRAFCSKLLVRLKKSCLKHSFR